MEKKFSSILASGLAMLAVSGFLQRNKPRRFAGLMNVDVQHSFLRLPLTLLALRGGFPQASLRDTRSILSFVGVFYLAIGSIGLADRKVGGLLPSKLTNFDLVYHFGVGALSLWLGTRKGRMMK